MRYLIPLLLCLSVTAGAQVNLYNVFNVPGVFSSVTLEHGNNYYVLASDTSTQVFSPTVWPHATQYVVHKYNVYTNALVASKVICGDTLQYDSTIIYPPMIEVKNGHLHIVYAKYYYRQTPGPYSSALYYAQLDTNLNVIVPEKTIARPDPTTPFTSVNLQYLCVGKEVVAVYNTFDTLPQPIAFRKYVQLDLSGNVVRDDTIGVPDFTSVTAGWPYTIHEYPGHKYLVTGTLLFPGNWESFYLADSNMQIIDTFLGKPGNIYNTPDIGGGFWPILFMQPLPSGNLIGGSNYYSSPIPGVYTALAKASPSTRFTFGNLVTFKKTDTTDIGHSSGTGYHNIGYNTIDNSIYYADVTHINSGGHQCNDSQNYVQVLCLDTSLNLKWKRYILPKQGACFRFGYLIASDGRPGVTISGGGSSGFNLHFYIYHLDSALIASIHDDPKSAIRNRVIAYPNPASNIITIDDIEHNLSAWELCDVHGRRLMAEKKKAGNYKVDIHDLPNGFYFIRVHGADGEVYQKNVVKE